MTVTLWHGDCLERMGDIPSGSVDLIATDPPYRVIGGGVHSEIYRNTIFRANDTKIFEHNDIVPEQYMPELFRVLARNGDCYVMTNNINLRALLNVAYSVGFKFHGLLAWRKNNCTPNRWYLKELEYVCFFYKGRAKTINAPSSKQVFEIPNIRNRQHPTEKPVGLFEHYIRNSSQCGQTVLDPFMGVGSAGVAAVNTDRAFIGIEKDAGYFAIAERRIQAAQSAARQLTLEIA